MEKGQYISIAAEAEGTYKDRGSRFIALAMPVSSEEEAKARLDEIRRKYHDAHTKAYAWRLGAEGEDWRVSDDGEPSGSAGRQILGQMMSRSLSDTLVVVIRYFGGIKLGIPGLIKAFKTASAEALDKAGTEVRTVTRRYRISFGYDRMNAVMRMVKDLSLRPSDQTFGDVCAVVVAVRLSVEEEMLRRAALAEAEAERID